MDALRVSVSDLDALRYFLTNEDAELEPLLAQLRRESEPTPAMRAGTALHTALEISTPGEYGDLTADGYTFVFDIDGEVDLPEIREVKESRDYLVNRCVVTLVGKVDALHGRRVDDHKFTSRYDGERFMGSYQWRAYLDIFDADEFRWNVFEARPDKDDAKRFIIRDIHRLTMHRYPGMREDLERELARFVDFARQHLPEKIRTAEAA